jgi:hypothetical protein
MAPSNVGVRLEARGSILAVLAVALVSSYQYMFFAAPDLLALPLWSGSALTLAFLLGNLSLAVPVGFAWWIIQADTSGGESYAVREH